MASDIGSVTKEMTQAIDSANQSFEYIWSTIADTARSMGSASISTYAISRTIAYNPQNKRVLDISPRIQLGTQKLCDIISNNLKDLQTALNNPAQWILVGKCYLLLGDFTNAYSSFAHVLRINVPISDVYFWYSIACVYQHFNFNEDALKFFKNADIKPDSPLFYDYHMRLGILYRALGETQAALNEFTIAAKCPPQGLKEDDINFQKTFTNIVRGNMDNAIKELRMLSNRYPQNLKILQQFTWSLSFRPDDASLNEAKQLIEQRPEFADDPLLKFVLARIALKNSDMETAYNRYCDCIADWCESPVFWCGLGVLYFKNDQRQDALIAFQRALYQKPEIAEAWLNLGLIFELMNIPANAQKIYEAGKQNCDQNAKLKERSNRLLNPRGQPIKQEIEEIKDSRFFSQVGDIHAQMITRTPPALPGTAIVADEATARTIEELRINYESLF